VRTVHDAISWGPKTSSLVPSTRNCIRPAYIAFLALKAIEKGDVLTMKETRPLLVHSVATADNTGIHVLLVNYADNPQKAQLTLPHLPKTARVKKAVLRRVPQDEVCGDGNWFPVGDPMAVFSNEPAMLTVDKSETVTASLALSANTVALLDIPIEK